MLFKGAYRVDWYLGIVVCNVPIPYVLHVLDEQVFWFRREPSVRRRHFFWNWLEPQLYG